MMKPYKLSIKDLVTLNDMARELAIKPQVIKTEEEARIANRSEKIFKRKFRKKWKVGDKYYRVSDLMIKRMPPELCE